MLSGNYPIHGKMHTLLKAPNRPVRITLRRSSWFETVLFIWVVTFALAVAERAGAETAQEAKRTASVIGSGAQEEGSADWLQGSPEGSYTIQLLVSDDRQQASRFAATSRWPDTYLILLSEGDGERYYVVSGIYRERELARQQIVRQGGDSEAWIRSLDKLRPGRLLPVEKLVQRGAQPLSSSAQGVAWAWSQSPSDWTVQWAATKSPLPLHRLVRRLDPPPGGYAIVPVVRADGRWYQLLLGAFEERGRAEAYAASLGGVGQRPWYRRFAELQQQISLTP